MPEIPEEDTRLPPGQYIPRGRPVIHYGRAREVPDTLRDARPGRSGAARRIVTLEVRLTRVYAMKPAV